MPWLRSSASKVQTNVFCCCLIVNYGVALHRTCYTIVCIFVPGVFWGFAGSPRDFFGSWLLAPFDHPRHLKSRVPPLGYKEAMHIYLYWQSHGPLIPIKIIVQFFECRIPERVLLNGAISICRRFSKVSHRFEAKMCGLSLLAIFTFWVYTLWHTTLVLYSKRKSSITAPGPLTTKLISKQARLTATKSVLVKLSVILITDKTWKTEYSIDRDKSIPSLTRTGFCFPDSNVSATKHS